MSYLCESIIRIKINIWLKVMVNKLEVISIIFYFFVTLQKYHNFTSQ